MVPMNVRIIWLKMISRGYLHVPLIGLVILLAGVFLLTNKQSNYYAATLVPHGEVGYNLVMHRTITVNPERVAHVVTRQNLEGRAVDYAEVNHQLFAEPYTNRTIQDTIGYGVLLGGLWSLTGSFKYFDVQILQFIMMCIIVWFYYSLILQLSASRSIAYWSLGLLAFYAPLLHLNSQPHRDVWGFYGITILLWTFVSVIARSRSWWWGIPGGTFFVLCQWFRPTIIVGLLGITLAAVIARFLVERRTWLMGLKILALFWILNGVLFWIPFMFYNKHAYGRFWVMSSGEALIAAFKVSDSPCGRYKLDDERLGEWISSKIGAGYGTLEFDDYLKERFYRMYHKYPFAYWRQVATNFMILIFPTLDWFDPGKLFHPLPKMSGFWKRLDLMIERVRCNPWYGLMELTARILARLIRTIGMLIFPLACLGLLIALWQGRFQLVLFLFLGGVLPAFGLVTSHIEPRYIIPYYAFYFPFVPLALRELKHRFKLLTKSEE